MPLVGVRAVALPAAGQHVAVEAESRSGDKEMAGGARRRGRRARPTHRDVPGAGDGARLRGGMGLRPPGIPMSPDAARMSTWATMSGWSRLSSAAQQLHVPHHADHGGDERNDEENGENEQQHGEEHLDAGFGHGFFGLARTLLAQVLGIDFQGEGQTGAEFLALDDHGGQRLNGFDSRPLDQLTEGRGAVLAGAHLHDYGCEFSGQFGIDELHLLADAHHGLVERQTGAQHDAQQIDGVGECFFQLAAVAFDQALQDHLGQHDTHHQGGAHSDGGVEGSVTLLQAGHATQNQRHEKQEEDNVDAEGRFAAESGAV